MILALLAVAGLTGVAGATQIGQEVAVPKHLADGAERTLPIPQLIAHGELLFGAAWTGQEGGGRPLTKGNGKPLADPSDPLEFPRNFNRLSAPDANSCGGCHNSPRSGGGGDIVTNVFVLAQRFDHITFDGSDTVPTKGSHDETGTLRTFDDITNNRSTLGMFGAGYIEMLAREMTRDLQAIRDGVAAGQSATLVSKGVSFGVLRRNADGSWDTSEVSGLPFPSLASSATAPPNLVLRPFHQAGAVVSLREFSNNAFNHHHGVQTEERFGVDADPDGDGFANEMTEADVTAVALYQATLPVPGRVIPRDREVEEAVLLGEAKFAAIGCTDCHVAALPLTNAYFGEPSPFNPSGNLQGDTVRAVNLNSLSLPLPRLRAAHGVTVVPAYTDLKLHDITSGPGDPNCEPLNMLQPAGSPEFSGGNCQFLTKKLWGAANEPPFFHHGKFTTMRQAIAAHAGEASASAGAWAALTAHEQDSIIEFLKTLQVLPEGTRARVVDESYQPRTWPPAR
jgi:hypothetical protein